MKVTARILLIEDNPENRYLVTFLLEQRGHTIIPAETGPLGLDLAARILPDRNLGIAGLRRTGSRQCYDECGEERAHRHS